MPTYEYDCLNCHHKFELIQKMSEPATKHCPACSKDTAVRIVSSTNFQLKGSGWYVTDFREPKKASESKSVETTSTKTE